MRRKCTPTDLIASRSATSAAESEPVPVRGNSDAACSLRSRSRSSPPVATATHGVDREHEMGSRCTRATSGVLGLLDPVDEAVDVVLHEERYSPFCISSAIFFPQRCVCSHTL